MGSSFTEFNIKLKGLGTSFLDHNVIFTGIWLMFSEIINQFGGNNETPVQLNLFFLEC